MTSILQSHVRTAENKRRMVFGDIHILLEHEGFNNEEVVRCLAGMSYIESEADARQWLLKYKEHQMAEAEKDFHAEMDKLAGEIEQIKMMKNKSQVCARPYFFE